MSTKSDTSWMPPNGSYSVIVGSTLAGALNANKGLPPAPKLSDRGFYSFRYNFKPESIDLYKPGTIAVKREGDRKTATIERPSTVPGEGQLFTGAENAAKDVDCVLIYDEELGTFTLEKLDSLINVTWGGKSTMPSNRPSEPPAVAAPSVPAPPTKKEYEDELDLGAELERELLSVIEDAPPKRTSVKKESPSLKVPTAPTPNGTSGSQLVSKKPAARPKPKPKEPTSMFMNPNSTAAKVANKKSAPVKQEPKLEQKSPVLSQPTPGSKLAKMAGDLKGKGVKREAEPQVKESGGVRKRTKLSPPPSKAQPQSRPQVSKPPPPVAGLPAKPQIAAAPPRPQPQPKPQLPAKKEFSLELPTGSSSGSTSNNPFFAGGGGTSLSLPTGPSTLGSTEPTPSALADTTAMGASDSESDWDEVEADVPPLHPQTQPQAEPEPYRGLGVLTIEEDPPPGFSGKLDVVEGDEDRYDEDADGEGDGEGEDIDMDYLMAEMAEELQDRNGGDQEGEGDGNEMDDFLYAAVSGEQDQDADQEGEVEAYTGGDHDVFGDEYSDTSSDDSDD